jgi:hypothetical protein
MYISIVWLVVQVWKLLKIGWMMGQMFKVFFFQQKAFKANAAEIGTLVCKGIYPKGSQKSGSYFCSY